MHPNVSLPSLNDGNLCDVSMAQTPRKTRVPLATLLPALEREMRRPGDVYMQRFGKRTRQPPSFSDGSDDSLLGLQLEPELLANSLFSSRDADDVAALVATLTLERALRQRVALAPEKSRFRSGREQKERQLRRKQVYDEHEADEISTHDLLVFNVPVMGQELGRGLLHADLELCMRPCPLPGLDSDSDISQNISDFYSQRLKLYLKLVRELREQLVLYKLPKYVRLQSLLDDLSLVSLEKLEAVHQLRPINLPPKSTSDRLRHSREFQRAMTSFELLSRAQNESRRRYEQLLAANQQLWRRVAADVRRVASEKNAVRRLAWETLIAPDLRYDFFLNVLSSSLGAEATRRVLQTYAELEARRKGLAEQMRALKTNEYRMACAQTLSRPLYRGVADRFRDSYVHLLFLKLLLKGGLKPLHENFVVPLFLVFFPNETDQRIFTLVELFDACVFTQDVFAELNKRLARWLSPRSGLVQAQFPKDEFDLLSLASFFEIVLQLNDQLPLSLSAPTTPVIPQGGFEQDRELVLDSSALSLVGILLQVLVVYSHLRRSKKANLCKVYECFLLTIFKFYHINWNSYTELLLQNLLIKLNNSSDQVRNLDSFLDKCKDFFKAM